MSLNQLLLLTIVTFFIYFIFIEIFTVLFRLTGMPKNKSRFQVISLFTNSGYTTKEAEMIVNHQMRRRIATSTMLVGYALNVTVIGVLINVFMTLSSAASNDIWRFLLYASSFLVFLIIITKVKLIDNQIQSLIRFFALKLYHKQDENMIEVLSNYSDFTVVEVSIQTISDYYDSRALKDSNMKTEYGIQVLAIKRQNEVFTFITGDSMVMHGDILVVSGNLIKIRKFFLVDIKTNKDSI